MKKYILLLFTCIIASLSAKVVYVNGSANASSTQDGLTWSTAYTILDTAIARAKDGDDIWIKEGNYKPDNGHGSYSILKSLNIYGGFSGAEKTLLERNVDEHVTLIDSADVVFFIHQGLNLVFDGLSFQYCGNVFYTESTLDPWVKPLIVVNNCTFLEGISAIYSMYNQFDLQFTNSKILNSKGNSNFKSSSSDLFSTAKFINCTIQDSRMEFQNCETLFQKCLFTNHTSQAISSYNYGSISVIDCEFSNNLYQLFYFSNYSPNYFENVKFDRNIFDQNNNLFNFSNSYTTFRNITYTNNTGYIYFGNADFSFFDSEFSNNTFGTEFIYSGGSASDPSNVNQVTNCKFYSNKASSGSLLYLQNNKGVAVNNCTFKNNALQNSSINSSYSLVVDHCTFDSNNAEHTANGASIIQTGGALTVRNSSFKKNVSYGGGAISSTVTSTFENCVFDSCRGSSGGAVYLNGSGDFSSCTFTNNYTNSDGSAIFSYSAISLDKCIFKNNHPVDESNGRYISLLSGYGSAKYIRDCIFDSNIGGMSVIYGMGYNGYSEASFENCTFWGNRSTESDGSITAGKNIKNSIFWNNKAKYQIYAPTPTYAAVFSSNIQGGFAGDGNTDFDPKFVDETHSNFRLTCASPLINKGNNDYAPDGTDLDGKPRIFGGTVDMGVYEFPQDPATATAPPTVQFSVSNANACKSEVIVFGNTTSPLENTRFEWDFGDGSKSVSIAPTHAYTQSGTFTVTLKATNACGANASLSQQIQIKPSFAPIISVATVVCPNGQSEFTTDTQCGSLTWSVKGGNITAGQSTKTIQVQWGDGSTGNGKVTLQVDNCRSGYCNVPVSIEIPIVPTIFKVQGASKVCEGGYQTYASNLKDHSPSTLYSWQAIGGSLVGNQSSGYDLATMSVNWATGVTEGKMILTTYNELLKCGGSDTLTVAIRPKFKVVGENQVCTATKSTYTIQPSGTCSWSISGTGANIESTGIVTWGNTASKYNVYASPVLATDYCNSKDSLQVTVNETPTILAITGSQEVDSASVQTYIANVSNTDVQYSWQITGGQNFGASSNQILVSWNGSSPYSIGLTVSTNTGNCSSAMLTLPIKTNFPYKITGPDTVCILSSQTYTSNTDPTFNAEVFNWSGGTGTSTANVYNVSFTDPGYQYVNLKIQRGTKTSVATKQVLVNAAVTGLSIKGATEVDPAGTGTYVYTIANPLGAAYTYKVVGASNQSKNGDDITVTWGGTEPFAIVLNSTMSGIACPGVPVTINVKKAPPLDNTIVSDGNACLNASVKYSFVIDQYTSNLQWSVSGGGVIINTGTNNAQILWGSTVGAYMITLKYDRFGTQTVVWPVTVNGLPSPDIADQTICGATATSLHTVANYIGYSWSLQDDAFSATDAIASVTKEGLYKVNVTDVNGCVGLGAKYIKQIPIPQVNIFTDQETLYCQDATGTNNISLKTLEGNAYQYQWYLNGNAITGANTPTYNFVLSLATPQTQEYTITTSVGICSQSVKETFTVWSTAQCADIHGGNPCTESAVSFTVGTDCQPYVFTNTSSAQDQSSWSFGDGTSYIGAQPPAKKYTTVGIFDVNLSRKCQSTKVRVEVPAVSIFKLQNPGCNSKKLSFKDYSANIPGLKILSWTWNFGDGTGNMTKTDGGTGKDLRDTSHTFAQAGTYTVVLIVNAKNSKGVVCSDTSRQTIKITASPVVDFTIVGTGCTSSVYQFIDKSTIATSAAKYLWTFQTGSTANSKNAAFNYTPGSKTIQLEVTDLWSCKSTISKTLEVVTPLPKGKITVNGDLLLCNGKTVTLTSPTGGTYIWKNGNTQVATTASYIASIGGKYTVTYSNTTCSITTDTVEVVSYKVNNLITGTSKVCVGNILALSTGLLESAYAFTWKVGTTTLASTGSNLYMNNADLSNSGDYSLTVTDKNNACMVTLPSFKVSVFNNPLKPVISTDVINVCYGSDFNLTTSAITTGYSLQWLLNNQIPKGTTNPYKAAGVDESFTGYYQLQIMENTSGCTAVSDPLFVKVYPQLLVAIKGDAIVCEQYPFALNTALSNTDYDFDWMQNGVSLQYDNNKYSVSRIALTDTGKYTVKIISKGTTNYAGCTTTSTPFQVNVKAGPLAPQITGPDVFCQGSQITLTSNVSNNIQWSTGENTQSIKVTLGGSYTVTATNTATGCILSNTKLVVQNPAPDFSFFPAGVYERCGSDKIYFAGLTNYPYYQWYVNGVKFKSPNKVLYPTVSGAYTLEVRTDKGCIGLSDTMFITSLECPCYVTNTKDAGDGSLREAINCSNAKEGKDIIKFAITENGGVGPFTISPLSALPTLTDSVAIDGFSQSGEGKYDIIIDGSTYTINALTLDYSLANCRIAGLVFSKFSNGISLKSLVSHNLIEKNRFILNTGNSIELSNNCSYNKVSNNTFETTGNGIALISESQYNNIENNTITAAQIGVGVFNKSRSNTIRNNQISNATTNGLLLYTNSSQNLVIGNIIGKSTLNGISIESNAQKNILDSNYIGIDQSGTNIANMKSGIYIAVGSDSNTVSRNKIGYNLEQGVNAAANVLVITGNDLSIPNQKFGILSTGSSVRIENNTIINHLEYGISVNSSSQILQNTLKDNVKGGIYVNTNTNKISKNTITNTSLSVKAIDLHATNLPAGNTGKVPATFDTYRQSDKGGLVLKGTSIANDTVEIFYNNHISQQALAYVGSAKTDAKGSWELEIPTGSYFDPTGRNYYVNTATTASNNTSELSDIFTSGCFSCVCLVENVKDTGSGSLRAAIDSAHTGTCLIVDFDINTPDTIKLSTPLRDIKVPVTINGISGTSDPAIAIEGNGIGIGLNVLNEGVHVNNLSFANWYSGISLKNDYALIDHTNIVNTKFPITITGDNNTLTNNCFNCNRTGTNTYVSDTAVVIRGNGNTFGEKDAGNTIINSASIGIKVDRGTGNQWLYNSLSNNPIAIKQFNNGNKNYAAPTNLVGSLAGTVAHITGKAKPGDRVQVFLSDLVAIQTAQPFVIETIADATGTWSVTVPNTVLLPNNNTYFVTTATQTDGTSELSDIVRVGNVPQICYVTNTLDLGKGSLRAAVDCANSAGKGTNGINAQVVFQLPTTMNLIELASGLTITNNYGVLIDPTTQIPVTLTTSNNTTTAFAWASNNLSLTNLYFENFTKTLVGSGNNASIQNNQFNNYTTAVQLNAGTQTVENNYFANGKTALVVQNGAASIIQNAFGVFKNATIANITDKAIQLNVMSNTYLQGNTFSNITNQALVVSKGQNLTLSGNTFLGKTGNTLEAVKIGNIQSLTATNNTIDQYTSGMRLDTVTNGSITLNTLTHISTYGLDLGSSKNLLLSQNTVQGLSKTGKPIRLNYGTAITSNNAKSYPKVGSITYYGGKLVVYGEAEPYDHVELFKSSDGIDLQSYIATLQANQFGKWTYEESMKVTDVATHYYRATAREDVPTKNTSEASDSIHLNLKVCTVLNTKDAGDNSLRSAIEGANQNQCNYVMFQIGTGGAATIAPITTLPIITAPYIIIDGTSQPGYVDTPLITVASTSQSYAFKSVNTPTFNLHALHTLGYDTAVAIQNTPHHLISLGTYENFTAIGLTDVSNSAIDGLVDQNDFVAAAAQACIEVHAEGAIVTNNTLKGGFETGILVVANTAVVQLNTIKADTALTNTTAILLNNAQKSTVEENVISNADFGIKTFNTQGSYINNNQISDSSSIKSTEIGIYLEQSQRDTLFGNQMFKIHKGVFGKNLKQVNIEFHQITQADTGVQWVGVQNSSFKNAVINGPMIGLLLDQVNNARIEGNKIFNITNTGIIIKNTSDQDTLVLNTIGAETLDANQYNDAIGLKIENANNHIIGLQKSGNTIFHNKKGGIIVDGGTGNMIRYNILFENDKTKARPTAYAIKLQNNGNLGKAKPSITNHRLNVTKDTLTVFGISQSGDSVHLYNGKGGYEEARVWFGSGITDGSGKFSVRVNPEIDVKKLLATSTLYLTATGTDAVRNTSPLSDMYILGDCYVTSLADTNDNVYPLPNTLRMAVKCANVQHEHVGIYYSVDQYNDKVVKLQGTLMPLKNSFGINYQGVNTITDRSIVAVDYDALFNTDSLAWYIDPLQGPSRFDHLKLQNWESGAMFDTDSQQVAHFEATNIANASIYFTERSMRSSVDSGTFNNLHIGVRMLPATHQIVVQNSTFNTVDHAIYAIDTTNTLSVKANIFQDNHNYTLVLTKAGNWTVANNAFSTQDGNVLRAIQINASGHVAIVSNQFVSEVSAVKPTIEALSLQSSEAIEIGYNQFTLRNNETAISLFNTAGSSADTNYINVNGGNAINLQSSNHNQFVANTIMVNKKEGFALQSSDNNLISRNTLTGTSKSVKCIQLNYNTVQESNEGIPTPKFYPSPLSHSVKIVNDRRGLFVTGMAQEGDSIEVFFSDSAYASMNTYIGTAYTGAQKTWELQIPRKYYKKDTVSWYHVVATATNANRSTSETDSVYHIPPQTVKFYVLNRFNDGPNSLRDALRQVDSCDLKSYVIFRIGGNTPYRIQLDSLLHPINSVNGFIMDGQTEQACDSAIYADKRIFVECAKVDSAYGLVLGTACDSSTISSIWFANAQKGFKIQNTSNQLRDIHLLQEDVNIKGDTALLILGDQNKITNTTILGYDKGVVIDGKIQGNKLYLTTLDSVNIGMVLSAQAFKNTIDSCVFINTDSLAVYMSPTTGVSNFVKSSTFGTKDHPIKGTAILIDGAKSQTITKNRIAYLQNTPNTSLAVAIQLKDTASFNSIVANTIGLDGKTETAYLGWNISLSGIDDTYPTRNNFITANTLVGASEGAIHLKHSNASLISNNIIGDTSAQDLYEIGAFGVRIDSSFNEVIEDNSIIGFESSAIEVKHSDYILMSRNILYSSKVNSDRAIDLNMYDADSSNVIETHVIQMPVITTIVLLDTFNMTLSGTTTYPSVTVDIFEGYTGKSQAFKYVNTVNADNSGNWSYQLKRTNFAFDKSNYYVAQLRTLEGRSSELSISAVKQGLLCDLGKIANWSIIDDFYNPCPGPVFNLSATLGKKLHYAWTFTPLDTLQNNQVVTDTNTAVAIKDSSYHVRLDVSDDFGCSVQDTALLQYKSLPFKPDFLVASNVFTDDTIVVIDVSQGRDNNPFTWSSTGGTVIKTSQDVIIGPDGKEYPKDRVVELQFIEKGTYVIKQTSTRADCYYDLEKTITVDDKKGQKGDKDPFIYPEMETLEVNPNPVRTVAKIHALVADKDPVALQIVSSTGYVLENIQLSGKTEYKIELPISVPAAVYTFRLITHYKTLTQKVIILE